MRYISSPDFHRDGAERIGILLVNTGTPAAPEARDVRKYLAKFLGDPRVVELPRMLWLPILYGLVLPFRPARSAKKYRKMADELKASQTDGESIKKMKTEDEKIRKEIEDGFRDQIKMLKDEMAKQAKENSEAVDTARFVVPPVRPPWRKLTRTSRFAENSLRNSVGCEG